MLRGKFQEVHSSTPTANLIQDPNAEWDDCQYLFYYQFVEHYYKKHPERFRRRDENDKWFYFAEDIEGRNPIIMGRSDGWYGSFIDAIPKFDDNARGALQVPEKELKRREKVAEEAERIRIRNCPIEKAKRKAAQEEIMRRAAGKREQKRLNREANERAAVERVEKQKAELERKRLVREDNERPAVINKAKEKRRRD